MLKRYLVAAMLFLAVVVPAAVVQIARADKADDSALVVYCGRSKSLVAPLLDEFSQKTGVRIEVRYADSTDLANLLIEEGSRTPADVFFSQDPGALGAVAAKGLLRPIAQAQLDLVPAPYRSKEGLWVGVSGRARVLAYSTARLTSDELLSGVAELTDPKWRGRIGWAPSNASFQLFVTAMRHLHGEDKTAKWLRDMKANGVRDYASNRPLVQAIADGEIDVALTNHYYLFGFLRDKGPSFPVANAYLPNDVGGVMSVAGAGVLSASGKHAAAERLVEFLLSEDAQRFFVEKTGEFPLVAGVGAPAGVGEPGSPEALERLGVDLSSLSDLRTTLDLLRSTGVLP